MRTVKMALSAVLLAGTLTGQAMAHDHGINGLLLGAGSGALVGQAIGRDSEGTLIGTAVGIPLSSPAELRERPSGSVPPLTDQPKGAVPEASSETT